MLNTGIFKDNCYHQLCIAGLLCVARGVPQINEAKYFIISRVACKYTCIKNTTALVLYVALLFMPRLSEH